MTTADESRAYMRGRGIAPELMRQASLRAGSGTMAGRVVFPWFDAAGAEVYATGRSLDGAKPKYRHTEGARPALYASPGAWEAPRVALVEGQIDACACAQGGTAAFATSGASAFSAEAADILATKHEVILVADADEAGTKWRGRVVEALGGRGVSLLEARLPDGASDIADVAERAQARGEDPSEVVAEVLAEAVPVEVEAEPETKGGFRLRPLDLTTLLAREPEPERFVVEPYIPRARRVWVFGAAESGKSIWALATAAQVSREGAGVAYFSEENPLDEDIRRLRRLRPDSSHFRFFSGTGLDLDLGRARGGRYRSLSGLRARSLRHHLGRVVGRRERQCRHSRARPRSPHALGDGDGGERTCARPHRPPPGVRETRRGLGREGRECEGTKGRCGAQLRSQEPRRVHDQSWQDARRQRPR